MCTHGFLVNFEGRYLLGIPENFFKILICENFIKPYARDGKILFYSFSDKE